MSEPLSLDPLELTKRYSAQVRRDKTLTSEHALHIQLEAPEVPGTYLHLDAEFHHHQLQALGYKIRSCAIGHASLGILLQYAQGMTLTQLQQARQQLDAILTARSKPSEPFIWPELALFFSAVTLIERHPVALLPFEALRQLFIQAHAQEAHHLPQLS